MDRTGFVGALTFAPVGLYVEGELPTDRLAGMMSWVRDYRPGTVRGIGAAGDTRAQSD